MTLRCLLPSAGFAWLLLLLAIGAQPAARGAPPDKTEEEVIPPATESYKGRKIATTMHFSGASWLTRDSRQREEDCETMLKQLAIKPGQVICDMGCGNGFYTVRLAALTGEKGKVLGVDIQQEMLHMTAERGKQAKLANIETLLGSAVNPHLPEKGVDLILCVDVYHEFSHPEQMLAAMRKSLRAGGRVALVEFRLEDVDVPIKLEHKMSKAQIMKEWPANGFKLVEQFDKLPWQHLMFFARDDDATQKEIPLDGGARAKSADPQK